MATTYDLQVVPNQRYDIAFLWKQVDTNGPAIPFGNFTAIMIIYSGQEALFTSQSDPGVTDSDLVLTQEPAGALGWLYVSIPADRTAKLLRPYQIGSDFSYFIYLLDNADSSNVIPWLSGRVIPQKGFGI